MRQVLFVDDETSVLNALQRARRQALPAAERQAESFSDPEAALLGCADKPFETDLLAVAEAVNRGAMVTFLTKPWIEVELVETARDAFADFEAKHSAPAGAAAR